MLRVCPHMLLDGLDGFINKFENALYGAAQRVINHQEKNGANYRNKKTVDVHAGDSRMSEHLENIAADHSSDDAQHDVQQDALPSFIDELTRDEARN